MLAGAQAVARDRIVRALRRSGDVDRLDARVGDNVTIVEGGAGSLGKARDLSQSVGADFTYVQLVDQGRTRQRLRADPPAPARADYGHLDLSHRRLLGQRRISRAARQLSSAEPGLRASAGELGRAVG